MLVMTRLLVNMSVWLVQDVVIVLRAITTTARLSLPMECPRKSSILVSDMELRPLAGLLVNISPGPATSVWVTVMCRRRLLDSLPG